MNKKKTAYGNNRGAAGLAGILIVIAVLVIAVLLAYGRKLESDMPAIEETGTDNALVPPGEPEKITPGAYKNSKSVRTKPLSGTDDSAQGQIVEEEGAGAGEAETPDAGQKNAHEGLFYYTRLSDAERDVYCQIYQSMITREKATLSTKDVDLADKLFQFVLWDHPEIFDTNGYQIVKHSLGDKLISLTMNPKFEMTVGERDNYQKLIEQEVNQIVSSVPAGLDSYGKVKFVYDYLIRHTEYELGCENSQNICSVFLLHRSVCAGYAKATQLLLQKLSIPSTIVHGTVDREAHAWNLVYIDQVPYYLDTTWGDASYSSSSEGEQNPRQPDVNYDYFLITETELERTHKIENKEYYPSVTATECNYYRKEGLYFEFNDKELLRKKIDEAYDQGAQSVTIRASTGALLSEIERDLVDRQEIFEYLRQTDTFYYNVDNNINTLTIWLY